MVGLKLVHTSHETFTPLFFGHLRCPLAIVCLHDWPLQCDIGLQTLQHEPSMKPDIFLFRVQSNLLFMTVHL